MTSESCVGCKFLYSDGTGYSNYTWLETYARCALGKNEALKGDCEEPFDLTTDPAQDTWGPTMNGRCERYAAGVHVTLDPDREDHPSAQSEDAEQITAICAADGAP
ncbi:MAG: hypothetical protein ACYC3L_00695 [Gemmatimonadaceae bacterium]